MTQLCRKCGLVKSSSMKVHIELKALSSLQAYREDLRIYV